MDMRSQKKLVGIIRVFALIVFSTILQVDISRAGNIRETVTAAIIADASDGQREIILTLKSNPSPEVVEWLNRWKEGGIYLHESADGVITPVVLTGKRDGSGASAALRVADGKPLTTPEGTALRVNPDELGIAETDSKLRRAMKEVTELAALASPDKVKRIRAIRDSAMGQNPDKLPALIALKSLEKDGVALRALEETIAIIRLKSTDPKERLSACHTLAELQPLAGRDVLRDFVRNAESSGLSEEAKAGRAALAAIDSHISAINAMGTAFRGLSLGSVLLVVAIGLAITFGLMGIINMAHGEFIAIGAYTTYVIQNLFAAGLAISPFGVSVNLPGLGLANGANTYFILAIPMSFLVAALFGVLLERTVIRFLYKRPLESLLATWGISLVIQQILKFVFGSNNVQVTSPNWLSGNWTVDDVIFGWNRVFVIAFAILIIATTWLVLNKTPLGLLIRSVMQNRNMAACMGVRTERVNTFTFAFGCGLAGLAGAFLSQIGNVGPAMGQLYIVDSFMTVVVGGVGNIMGTVISALGIGIADQSLQQYLGNPVIGKILVLASIILFLQWRPAGLFVTRSRSLD